MFELFKKKWKNYNSLKCLELPLDLALAKIDQQKHLGKTCVIFINLWISDENRNYLESKGYTVFNEIMCGFPSFEVLWK